MDGLFISILVTFFSNQKTYNYKNTTALHYSKYVGTSATAFCPCLPRWVNYGRSTTRFPVYDLGRNNFADSGEKAGSSSSKHCCVSVNALLLLLLLMLESLQAFWSRSSTIQALANFEKFTRAFLAPNSSPKSVSGRLVVDKSGHLYISTLLILVY